MPTRRVVKSALRGFLGTYTSRYSDFQGYWVFGQIGNQLNGLRFDLLDEGPEGEHSPLRFARALARRRFAEQLEKAGLAAGRVIAARLEVRSFATGAFEWCGDYSREGVDYEFVATAKMDDGRAYSDKEKVFVAVHDGQLERRRHPEHWGRFRGDDCPKETRLAVVI